MITLRGLSKASLLALSLLQVSPLGFAADDRPLRRARNYELYELTLNGEHCRVNGIDAGAAVGTCNTPDRTAGRAFIWTKETGVVDIGTLGGSSAGAGAIDGRRVAGSSSTTGDTASHVFSWTAEAGMLDLGTLGGDGAGANGISGEAVVGESLTAAGDIHAFSWTPLNGMIDLGTLASGTESSAADIHGDLIAGWSAVGIPGRRPVAWRTTGEMIDLVGEPIELAGVFVRGDGQATAVRNGLVVGYRRIAPSEQSRAFAWRDGQGLVDLGLVPGSIESFAFDTDGRWVVGQLSGDITTGYSTRAFIWSETHAMKAITPASITARATHVSNGRVVGFYSSSQTNGSQTFLWTRQGGLVDVTPLDFPPGTMPIGIDAEGRIAIISSDEDQFNIRSFVLIPK
jgi:probable HAF family extracellular repeat protein